MNLEHMAQAFGLPYSTSAQPCACCKANSSDIPWTDGRLGEAAWVATIWNNTDWSAAHPNAHPILKLPGLGIQSFLPDLMHTLYLGAYQYVFGSVLKLLTHHILGDTPEANLATVWEDIVAYYKVPIKMLYNMTD